MKILGIGDAHLWPIIRPKLPAMRGDAFAAFRECFSIAAREEVQSVVSVGDIFDYGERGGVSTCMQFLAEAGMPPFWAIEGNHDLPGYSGVERNAPWVAALGHQVKRIEHLEHLGEYSMLGIDYCRGREEFLEKLEAAKAQHPGGVDILVLHQGHQQLLGFEGAWEVCDSDVAGWANVVLIGHVHKAVSWRDEKGTLWVSPGSLYRWRSVETDMKRVPIITLGDGTVDVDWVPLTQQRDMFYLVAETEEERQEVLRKLGGYQPRAELAEELRMPYVSLQYVPEPGFVRALSELVPDRFHLEAKPIRVGTATRIATEGTTEEAEPDAEESLEAQVARVTAKHVDKELDPDLYQLAVNIQLDMSANPAALIDEAVELILRTEFAGSEPAVGDIG